MVLLGPVQKSLTAKKDPGWVRNLPWKNPIVYFMEKKGEYDKPLEIFQERG